MSDAVNDGGPAMLVDVPSAAHYGFVVLNLRDYFAAQAMAGEIGAGWREEGDEAEVAMRCYTMADAMLKARSQ